MEQEVALKKPKSRILALDILRGITVAGMIMVNNPGSWGAIYAPLEHASWLGLTERATFCIVVRYCSELS